jgi:glutaredoxin|tara:strand:+ start:51 stop:452 length:402 start_codon:yes stop_codon:yes gene_type:complete
MEKIEIYTNKNCPYCKRIKEELLKNKINFNNIDTIENKNEWQDIVSLTNMPTVPTIKINEEYLVAGRDFGSPENLINIIKNYKDNNYDHSRLILEKIKTLNYYMSQAFQRTDQLLRQIENKLNIKEDEHKSTD